MRKLIPVLTMLLLPFWAVAEPFETAIESDDEAALVELLYEFLKGASYGDAATHDRFWSEELIYTGSAGTRTTKADIMEGANPNPERSAEPEMRYDAEEIQVKLYGDMAVVAFKLIGLAEGERMEFYNTGTFRKYENGEWRAVAWQATRIPD
ncbi:MAG: nuclear transport factor 2 family protein [Balneolaceae bacterium]|nr:nuclear transport factor 2 family protein [Balneolaceae bacterium]MCH8549936.1 nuclear transport factor 2 family protein [Balneolaceae bacterium]